MRKLILLTALLLVATAGLLNAQSTEPSDGSKSAARLRSLMQGVLMYSAQNRGYVPPHLSLTAQYFGDSRAAILLGDQATNQQYDALKPEELDRAIEQGSGLRILMPADTKMSRIHNVAETPAIMLHDVDDPSILAIAYMDGHVDLFRYLEPKRVNPPAPRVQRRPATLPATRPAP